MAKAIADKLTNKSCKGYLPEKDLEVFSFYSAQISMLKQAFTKSDVKCGTVDSFQRSERELVILYTTTTRCRQGVIKNCNKNLLETSDYWRDIYEWCSWNKGTLGFGSEISEVSRSF